MPATSTVIAFGSCGLDGVMYEQRATLSRISEKAEMSSVGVSAAKYFGDPGRGRPPATAIESSVVANPPVTPIPIT